MASNTLLQTSAVTDTEELHWVNIYLQGLIIGTSDFGLNELKQQIEAQAYYKGSFIFYLFSFTYTYT